mmetsp:Transcript_986/g.3242  ORF Transcript_986/g.3242 Transcript_986/m.3242 type:complete len:425 (-) Transcript_986:158-1432(-)
MASGSRKAAGGGDSNSDSDSEEEDDEEGVGGSICMSRAMASSLEVSSSSSSRASSSSWASSSNASAAPPGPWSSAPPLSSASCLTSSSSRGRSPGPTSSSARAGASASSAGEEGAAASCAAPWLALGSSSSGAPSARRSAARPRGGPKRSRRRLGTCSVTRTCDLKYFWRSSSRCARRRSEARSSACRRTSSAAPRPPSTTRRRRLPSAALRLKARARALLRYSLGSEPTSAKSSCSTSRPRAGARDWPPPAAPPCCCPASLAKTRPSTSATLPRVSSLVGPAGRCFAGAPGLFSRCRCGAPAATPVCSCGSHQRRSSITRRVPLSWPKTCRAIACASLEVTPGPRYSPSFTRTRGLMRRSRSSRAATMPSNRPLARAERGAWPMTAMASLMTLAMRGVCDSERTPRCSCSRVFRCFSTAAAAL